MKLLRSLIALLLIRQSSSGPAVATGIFALFSLFAPFVHADWRDSVRRAVRHGGVYVESESGKPVLDHRADQRFIPASTMKLVTGIAALRVLGPDARFETEVGVDSRGFLVIRGRGDPFLVSEELELLAAAVKRELDRCSGLVIDTSLFASDIVIDGSSQTLNPYDAIPGALLVNFNTVAFKKLAGGEVAAGEVQTPVTPIVKEKARGLPIGSHRVNLGPDGPRYSAELIAAFLRKAGVAVNGPLEVSARPVQGMKPRFVYRSSRTLEDILRGVLRYSTNFSSNQLFLVLGMREYGAPATVEKGARVLRRELAEILGSEDFALVEGAGLSRGNGLTPRQLTRVVKAWEPYRDLLPQEGRMRAKTGTLTGVSTLAGFVPGAGGAMYRFAIMVNDDVPGDYKFSVAKLLERGLNGGEQ